MSTPEVKIPAVDPVTRVLNYTSVSALQKFNPEEYGGCESRWWFKYVEHLTEAQTAQQEEGIKGHKQIEHYLPSGQDGLGPIAAAGRHLLPAPGADLFVEHGLNDRPRPADVDGRQINFFPLDQSLLRADGLPLIGFMDWINPRGWYVSPDGILLQDPPNTVEVGDNKFTSNVAYAKTAKELEQSTQMVGYSEFLTAKYPWLEHVRASHNSFQTRGSRAAVKTTTLLSLATIKAAWEKRGHAVVRRMREVALIRREEDVPANLKSCEAYRKKCDFCNSCSKYRALNPLKRMTMGLLANRKPGSAAPVPPAAVAANGASTTPWIPPPPPGVVPTPERKIPIIDVIEPITAQQATSGATYKFSNGWVGMFLSAVAQAGGQVTCGFLPQGGGTPVQVNPLEQVVLIAGPKVETPPPPPAPPAAPIFAAPPPPPAGPPAPPAGPPAPPLLQRVTRDPNAPPPPPPLSAQAAAPAKGKRAKKEDAPATGGNGIRLFLNAVPNGEYKTLDGYLAAVLAEMQEVFQVADIRFPPGGDHPLAYARWEGALAAAVREGMPPAGDYVVFRGSKMMDIVVEALIPSISAGNLIRAL